MSTREDKDGGSGPAAPGSWDPPPPDFYDPVIEAYKKDVDRTLLIENLRLSVDQRLRKFKSFVEAVEELRGAARGEK
jgi:hypothetical protein